MNESEILTMNNLVSVVTPAYNSESTIIKCIESVATQTLTVLEHIIVDDGSLDSTVDKIMSVIDQYPHVRLIKQKNSGAGIARNKAIEEAKGRYIAFLDSDDLWLPNKLFEQISFMEKNRCAFSYGQYYRRVAFKPESDILVEVPATISYNELLIECSIGCLTAAYNQEIKGKVYMSTIRRGQDWSLWLSLTRDGTKAQAYDGCHAIYNIMPGSLSKNRFKKFFDVYSIYRENDISIIFSFIYCLIHSFNVLFRKRM